MSNLTEPQKAWIAALRSGDYQQCTRKLHEEGVGHCCLGVLCEVAVEHGVIESYDGKRTHPVDSVIEWIGLGQREGYINTKDGRFTSRRNPSGYLYLTAANDDGATFEQIADFIEAHPDAVFYQLAQ